MKLLKIGLGSILTAVILLTGAFLMPTNPNQRIIQPLLADIEQPQSPSDIGIVLGAGLNRDGTLTDISRERVDHALDIYEDTNLEILFSGGDTPYGVEAIMMYEYANENGYEGPEHIEGSSTSTYENAFFSDELLDQAREERDSVLLITSPYHSRRALATFRTLMPEREAVITYPQSSAILEESFWGRLKGFRLLVREYLATLWYKQAFDIQFDGE
jgi:vancomycin permeability regulator SanA